MNADAHIIDINNNITHALKKLNALSGQVMTLFVVDDEARMVGTLTDGDIRRALVAGATLDTPISEVMHKNFRAITEDRADVKAIRDFRENGIKLIPQIDTDGKITDIVDLTKKCNVLPLGAVLMAGGKGERLRPLTLTTPKPLLKIGDKAIIDYNIDALIKNGIKDITVTTHYLADKIKDHFAKPVEGVQVKCVEENTPLGTIGAVTLAHLPEEGNTIVMNSDLLTTISFEEMYIHHIDTKADITIAAIPYQVSVPYAILTTTLDGNIDRVTGIEEKPSYTYFANGGIYIFSNKILNQLPRNVRIDAPDAIENAIAEGKKISVFPINGTWIDVGSPNDFRQATELIKYVRQATNDKS